MKHFVILISLLVVCVKELNASNLEKITEFYKQVETMEAVVIQKKKADYLQMPIESKIKFSKDATGKIIWDIIEPVKTKIEIKDGQIVSGLPQLPQGAPGSKGEDKFTPILKIIDALVSADFEFLRTLFDLDFKNNEINAKPNSKNLHFPFQLHMIFTNDLHIKTIELTKKEEQLTLSFNELKITRKKK